MRITATQKRTINGLLRQLVILRDSEKCLRCSKIDRLQMSHIYPKGTHRKMEFLPENLKLLCVGCHLYWWHKNPIEAWEWLRETIPKERISYLKLRSQVIDKSQFDYNLTKLYLDQEIKKFQTKSI